MSCYMELNEIYGPMGTGKYTDSDRRYWAKIKAKQEYTRNKINSSKQNKLITVDFKNKKVISVK